MYVRVCVIFYMHPIRTSTALKPIGPKPAKSPNTRIVNAIPHAIEPYGILIEPLWKPSRAFIEPV